MFEDYHCIKKVTKQKEKILNNLKSKQGMGVGDKLTRHKEQVTKISENKTKMWIVIKLWVYDGTNDKLRGQKERLEKRDSGHCTHLPRPVHSCPPSGVWPTWVSCHALWTQGGRCDCHPRSLTSLVSACWRGQTLAGVGVPPGVGVVEAAYWRLLSPRTARQSLQ